jgi:hypothetical protein
MGNSDYVVSHYMTLYVVNTAPPTSQIEVGHAVPLMFSPDGTEILVNTGTKYAVLSLNGTTLGVIDTLPIPKSTPHLLVSPSRNYLSLQGPGGPVQVYFVDWKKFTVTKATEFTPAQNEAYGFGKGDTLLRATSSSLAIYALTSSGAAQSASHPLKNLLSADVILNYQP